MNNEQRKKQWAHMGLPGSSGNSELTASPVSLIPCGMKIREMRQVQGVSVREWKAPEQPGAPWNLRDLRDSAL